MECRFNKDLNKWEIAAKDFDNFARSLGNEPDFGIQKIIAQERLDNLNKSLYYVKGIKGDMIPTESVYSAFIKPLTEFTKKFPDRYYINTSLVGAQIDGFENLPIEKALADAVPINNRALDANFRFDVQLIKENLFKAKGELEPALMITSEIIKTCKNLKTDINRYKNVTVEILKDLKKISTGYTTLSIDYSKKSPIFDYITTSERIDLDYEMKMFKEISVESVERITEKIEWFCAEAEKKIKEIDNTISKVMEEV